MKVITMVNIIITGIHLKGKQELSYLIQKMAFIILPVQPCAHFIGKHYIQELHTRVIWHLGVSRLGKNARRLHSFCKPIFSHSVQPNLVNKYEDNLQSYRLPGSIILHDIFLRLLSADLDKKFFLLFIFFRGIIQTILPQNRYLNKAYSTTVRTKILSCPNWSI